MLRASRRVLRPGGRTAFFTIHVAPGLSPAARRRAAEAGPPAVTSHGNYRNLMRSAGFVEVEEHDVTAAYLETARAWLRHVEDAADDLAAVEPPGLVADRLARRREVVAAIESGLLRRSLLIGS
ncbi:hypothetical protein [Pseudonocardia asaccharolytica]|uniref:Methyltransferase type 11 domain-containing protein n=1 Tax=Pseudonocardia asaccharolytica DSM 44247 = NBRC 16224 TaxID=1123024 RepID=A0A511D638_9PSEU|nr:hypothetical protein [Pseudonocardia asaccharolytica]GEL20250.1 hypothetical protein PA7_40870 [Pseudonocardia asaccharolytica DSM 44247 = NBRC 16224]